MLFPSELIRTKKGLRSNAINEMPQENKKESFLQRNGKLGAIIGVLWIGLNIVLPLALLRIPAVQQYLVAFEEKLPFDIPGIG